MTDLALMLNPNRKEEDWVFDLDIIDGIPETYSDDTLINNSRLLLCAIIQEGSIPLHTEWGADLAGLMVSAVSLAETQMKIKQNIQDWYGSTGAVPLIVSTDKGLVIKVSDFSDINKALEGIT
jgi:hypothetical protein